MIRCRAEMRELAAKFDNHLATLRAEYEDMIKQMRAEQDRNNKIDAALCMQPGPDDLWLN